MQRHVRLVGRVVAHVGRLGEVAHGQAVPAPEPPGRLAAQGVVAQHLAQLLLEVVVQPPVEEGVDAGAAHGEDLEQQIREAEELALDDLLVELGRQHEEVPGQPAHGEGQHDGDQDAVGALVAARVVLLDGPAPQHVADVGVEDGGEDEGQDELQQEAGAGVHLQNQSRGKKVVSELGTLTRRFVRSFSRLFGLERRRTHARTHSHRHNTN